MCSIKRRATSDKTRTSRGGNGRRLPPFRSKIIVGCTGLPRRPDEQGAQAQQSPPAERKVVGQALLASWLRLFHPEPNPVIEMRLLKIKDKGRSYTYNVGGYFDAEHFLGAATRALDREAEGTYFTLNPLRNGVDARCQNKLKQAEAGRQTTKNDVAKRQWLPIDADPVRPSGISSTKEERDKAWQDIRPLRDFLKAQGWADPVVASSGNGYHLYYRIDLPANDGGLVERVLKELDRRFSTPETRIDPAIHNSNQITKLYGTFARKGENTADRPHRRSHLIEVPGCESPWDVSTADVRVVSKEQLEAVGGAAAPRKRGGPSRNGRQDHKLIVPTYLTHVGVTVHRERPGGGGTVWHIECPFDPSHGGNHGDTVVGQLANGATYFTCNHPDCGGKGWADFKKAVGEPLPEHYDPPKGRRPAPRREGVGVSGVSVNAGGTVATSAPDGDEDDVRVEVELAGNVECVAAGVARALAVRLPAGSVVEHVYERNNALATVVKDGRGRLRPAALPKARLVEFLAPRVRLLKDDGSELSRPPDWLRDAVFARQHWDGLPGLTGVIRCPVLRPDGTLLLEPGYDPATRLLLDWHGDPLDVPENPTKADAMLACNVLLDAVAQFPFEKLAHQASYLSAVLTPLARPAFFGPAPLHLCDANVRGSGKTKLLSCPVVIATGEMPEPTRYSRDEEELDKRLHACSGEHFVFFDNVRGEFGGGLIDMVLTAPDGCYKSRVLKENRMTLIDLSAATWFCTGNNLTLVGDTARRVCYVRLRSTMEHPETRGGFRHPDLLAHVKENRRLYLSAALTILRAFHLAGRPADGLPPAFGSFEGWSALVRAAVVWCGLPDPWKTNLQLQEEADVGARAMAALLVYWQKMDPQGEGLTTSEVIDKLYDSVPWHPSYHQDMRAVIEDLGCRKNARRLGYVLRAYRGRFLDGRCIEHAGVEHNSTRWVVKTQEEPEQHDLPLGTCKHEGDMEA
jgi:hypothetical protein